MTWRKDDPQGSESDKIKWEIVPHTRGSPFDPSAQPLAGDPFWRTAGKIGIDATAKARHDPRDFVRSWPRHWGKVRLEDYL